MTWAITGTGLVTSLGRNVEESFESFCRAGSGLHPLRAFDASRYRVQAAYEIPDRTDRTDLPGRASRWLCEAIRQAMAQAGLAGWARQRPVPRIAVLVGTGLAEQRSLELWWTAGAPLSPDRLHFAGAVARELGLPDTVTLVNACSASLFALAVGTDLLALGEADAVVVAGADALTESMVGLLDRVSGRPPTEVRPFDADRQGVLLGEGAAAVVLETPLRAGSRDAAPLALVRGVGTACDAYHVTAPLRDGMARAFRDAYERAATDPAQIDLLLAHATGTVLNDETEASALHDVFGPAVGRPLVTALKSLIGHTSGASGLMGLVTAIAALDAGRVPPTLNSVRPIDSARDLRLVTGQARRADLRTAQVNAFGFGGVNAVAVLDRAQADAPAGAPVGADAARAGRRVGPDPLRGVAVTGTGLAIAGVASLDELLAGTARPGAPDTFDPVPTLGRHGLRYKDRATTLGLCAAAHALADAGIPAPGVGAEPVLDFGVVVSSTLAIAQTVCRVADTIHGGGVEATSPMDLPNVSGNVAASSIAIWFRLAGLNLTVSAGAASGVTALYLATAAIRSGRARQMLVVGVEPADPVVHRLLAEANADSGVDPVPFHGAVAVVLEGADAAAARGAAPRGLVGRYDRHARPQAVGHAREDPPLWMIPCQLHPAPGGAIAPQPADRIDLSRTVGEAGGALGVLQCAVAAHWLHRNPGRWARISSGGCWGEGFASLSLRGVR